MTTRAVRWGMIGCGAVTEVKSGPALQKAEGSTLVAVAGRRPGPAEAYARRHGVPRWYDDPAGVLHDPEVDIVYVATPPDAHLPLALACARAGKPAYVEKPMALDGAQCDAMNEAFRAAGLPLYVAYYRRALPRFRKVKELVDAGAVGTPRLARVALSRPAAAGEGDPSTRPWRVRPEIAGGGHFVDLACHTLDVLDFALGPIAEVAGLAGNQAGLYPAEDVVCCAFRFEGGAFGSGAWSFAAGREDLVEIVGDRGTLRFATFDDRPVELERGGAVVERHDLPNPPHIQQPLVQTIVDEWRGVGSCPSTGVTAARTSRVMDAAVRGYRGPRAG